jgi:hypothetical protein
VEKRAPINTTKEARDNPLGMLLGAMVMGSSGAIEHQEATGQRDFVQSTTLPTDIHGDGRKVLEAAGVKFGEVVDGDPMFQHVELPKGWKKQPTDHSMWNKLVDDKGRERAAIFYKAAFYDRSAHMSVTFRYSLRFDYDRFNKEGIAVSNVMDGQTIVHTTEPVAAAGKKSWEVSDASNAAAEAWLKEHFPNWRDAGAYWD